MARALDPPASIELPRFVRALASGAGFTFFGLGSLVLVFVCFPWIRLVTRDPRRRARRARRVIEASFRLFVRSLEVMGACRTRYRNLDQLAASRPVLILANHPSLIDVCLLVARIPDADCVVKREAFDNPFFGGVVRAADYIPNDGGESLVQICVERLRQGRCLILFPEGTRSPTGRLGSFKRGAARIALQAGCPVQLVDIECRPPFLRKGDPWYQVPRTLPCYTVTAHAPMAVGGTSEASEASEARRLTRDWRRGYEERLGYV